MIQEVALLVLFKFVNVLFVRSEVGENSVMRYTNMWAVQVSKNDDGVLEQLRKFEGFEIVQQKHQIPNLHLIIHKRHPRNGRYENTNLTNILFKYKRILWAQHISLKRTHLKSFECPGKSVSGPSNYKGLLNDKLFPIQFHLQDCRKSKSETRFDLNVVPVWHHYKYFGYPIKVVVIDDGIQTNHPDLKMNYDPEYGYDFIKKVDSLPPKGFMSSTHGTIMAGIIAMQANNKVCGVGITPLVTLGVLRKSALDVPETHYQEAAALRFRAKDLDVSNNSWGDIDDGKFLEPLNPMIMASLKHGITEGRRSKGLIFVFPSGNGKKVGDTCAHDAYASSMYTITVAGVKHDGSFSALSERCSNVLVTVYGGDSHFVGGGIISTTTWSLCQKTFSGTSAAVAIVSGIAALILEANYELSWRGVHHVFAWTSQVAPLAHNKVWFRNVAGFYFSLDFGFGLADAFQAVTFAKTMKPIPPLNSCILAIKSINDAVFNRDSALGINIKTNGCNNLPSVVNYMEHVQLVVNVKHQRRGAIKIVLMSPLGTKTILMESRRLDRSTEGLRNHIMDTVHLWGEPPQGKWSIIFYDTSNQSDHKGTVIRVYLFIHGTKDEPPHYVNARTYNEFHLSTYENN